MMGSYGTTIRLEGINGANPLGFLCALGTLAVVARNYKHARLGWQFEVGQWMPVLVDGPEECNALLDYLDRELAQLPMDVFEHESRMPFAAGRFREILLQAVRTTTERRELDLLAALGSEAVTNDDGTFLDTAFRMVRSADNSGNGFPAYAVKIRRATTRQHLERALFLPWDYSDDQSTFRWDPAEDAPYALRWDNPSTAPNRTMLGANSLAIEALIFFPSVPVGSSLVTTGFSQTEREMHFTWPIWEHPLGPDPIRSLVSHPELHRPTPDRTTLRAMGIAEIFRSRRFAPNQYYKNFSPAQPA